MQAVMENEKYKIKRKSFGGFLNFVGAIGGFTGGLIFLLIGLFLSAISYFNGINFDRYVIVSLVSALAFAAFGAHFLDKMDAIKKAERIERCRKTGLKN